MFELSKQFRFESAHTLERIVDASTSRRIHGHSYLAEVTIRGTPDKATGMVMDIGTLDALIATAREGLDHHLLDDIPGLGPATIENLCVWIWNRLSPGCPGLVRVTLSRPSVGDACNYFGAVY